MLKVGLVRRWESIKSSYWLVPSAMAVASFVLHWAATSADVAWPRHFEQVGWLYRGDAAAAIDLLSTLASSTVTVTGVVFSITIVVLSMASAQLGPRLLRKFRSDVGTQVTLGTLVATFFYCILLLRVLRPGERVPNLSVSIGVLLSFLAFAMLIYFIGHLARLIQADYLVASVARDLDHTIARYYPERFGNEPEPGRHPEQEVPADFAARARPVCALHGGYIQIIDREDVLELAHRHDLVVRLLRRAGHFVVRGMPIAAVWPPERCTSALQHQLAGAFGIGGSRSPAQDVEYAVRQMVEVALRALSPSLNDSFTAISCVDHLSAAIARCAALPDSSAYHLDTDGGLRVISTPVTFSGLVDEAFVQIRQSAAGHVAVAARLLEALGQVAAAAVRSPEKVPHILRHADMVRDAILSHVTEPYDRDVILKRHAEVYRQSK